LYSFLFQNGKRQPTNDQKPIAIKRKDTEILATLRDTYIKTEIQIQTYGHTDESAATDSWQCHWG